MVDDRNKSDEPFLRRWARLKSESASDGEGIAGSSEGPATPDAVPHAPPAAIARTGDDAEESEIDLAALPEVDSLDERSDFSIFMQNGIPDELRTRALQRLWRMDPSFGHIDGLLEYGEDYTGSGLAEETVQSIYQVGKGMLSEETETTEATAATARPAPAEKTDRTDSAPAPVTETEPAAETPPDDTRDDSGSGPARTG